MAVNAFLTGMLFVLEDLDNQPFIVPEYDSIALWNEIGWSFHVIPHVLVLRCRYLAELVIVQNFVD